MLVHLVRGKELVPDIVYDCGVRGCVRVCARVCVHVYDFCISLVKTLVFVEMLFFEVGFIKGQLEQGKEDFSLPSLL